MSGQDIDEEFALSILYMCKDADIQFWSVDKFDTMKKSWAAIFAASGLTRKAIQSGVIRFYANDTTGERPKPGIIIHQAKIAKQEWLQTPKGRAWAEKERLKAQQERDKALENGTWTPRGT